MGVVKDKREWLAAHKMAVGCEVCGERHPATLDCHHKDPREKLAIVGSMVNKSFSLKQLQEEIAKCVILCANCHRKRHWKEPHEMQTKEQIRAWHREYKRKSLNIDPAKYRKSKYDRAAITATSVTIETNPN